MNQKQIEKWKTKRAKGKSEFILKDGGIIYGLIGFGLVLPVVRFIVGYVESDLSFAFLDKSFLITLFIIWLTSFPIGCLWGWVMWNWNEFDYRRSKENLK